MKPKAMIVAGLMSGTSADGIDVALVRIVPGSAAPKLTLLDHEGFAFPAALRKAILAAMNASAISTAELARLNWRLGIAYADALQRTISKSKICVDLAGCHGQTLYHQPIPSSYLGKKFPCTWQLGEAQVIASTLAIPVVSNFRPADILAGGQGAPLVPFLDYALFAHPRRNRVLQNIGGIANLTAIPAGAMPQALVAFDNGPGNMILDTLASELLGKPYDNNGACARRGVVLNSVLKSALRHPFYKLNPPRTAGREQFGREYALDFLAHCRQHSQRPQDALATATALTVESIALSFQRYVHPHFHGAPTDYIVSGGGAHNATLMNFLSKRLDEFNCTVSASDDHGLPAAAKEAAAFALLAWQSWHHLPGNLQAATGAAKPALLGQITYA